jgi:hypothetical protein
MPINNQIWGFSPDMGDLGDTLAGGITSYMDNRRFANAIKEATGPDGTVDYNKVRDVLASAGDPKGALLADKLYGETEDDSFDSDPYGRIYSRRTGRFTNNEGGGSPVDAHSGVINKNWHPHKSQDEAKAGSFHKEAAVANSEIEGLGNVPGEENWISGAASAIDKAGDGGIIGSIAHQFTQPGRKQYDNAASRFINAINRRESGQQVRASEWQDAYERYLPRKGDDPETLRRKAYARKVKLDGIAGEAGPMYDPNSVAPLPPAPIEASAPSSAPTPRRVRTMSVSPADGSMSPTVQAGTMPMPTMMPGAPKNPQSKGPLPFEPDPAKRVIGQVYVAPSGKQYLWAHDGAGVGWEPL